jgi:uncharacterized protein YgbK (DUF1537 family)
VEREMNRLGIIADDLTGAMDAAVQFSKLGLVSIVLLNGTQDVKADVVVINTNSRADPPQVAYRKARQAAKQLTAMTIYKKIDSTLRGNIGQELEAIMDELGIERAIVAPAFPANGRTTVGGRQLLHGLPLEETQIARDPVCPVSESHIPTLLRRQVSRRVGWIGLATISQGEEALVKEIKDREEEILIFDATERAHLASVARMTVLADVACLACGSAGLAEALPAALGYKPRKEAVLIGERASGPVLVVAGSRNEVTARQIEATRDILEVPIVEPDPVLLSDEQASVEAGQAARKVRDLFAGGQDVIITSASSKSVPGMSQVIARGLANIAKRAIDVWRPTGLVLTGGDIAIQVCRALGASAIKVEGEVLPGIPAATVIGGEYEGLNLVTKAGGFGAEYAIVEAIRYLKGGKA